MLVGDDGPGFQALVTPAVFATELERVRALIDQLAGDVARVPVAPELRPGWTAFVMRWGAFYRDHRDPSWLSVALSGPFNLIFGFEREALRWRSALVRAGVPMSGPEPSGPSTPFGELAHAGSTLTSILWAGAALLGVYAITRR